MDIDPFRSFGFDFDSDRDPQVFALSMIGDAWLEERSRILGSD